LISLEASGKRDAFRKEIITIVFRAFRSCKKNIFLLKIENVMLFLFHD